MINIDSIEKAKKALETESAPRIVMSQNIQFNRALLEYGKFDILLYNTKCKKQDSLKQPDILLNEYLVKITAKKNIAVGLDSKEISALTQKEQAKELARIRFLLSLCKKAKTRLAVLNATDKYAAQAFLIALGASTQQAAALVF